MKPRTFSLILNMLGTAQAEGGGGPAVVAVPQGSDLAKAMASLEEDEDEQFVCMVCKEGYRSAPSELLATYCFCKRLPAGECPSIVLPSQPAEYVRILRDLLFFAPGVSGSWDVCVLHEVLSKICSDLPLPFPRWVLRQIFEVSDETNLFWWTKNSCTPKRFKRLIH